MSGIIGLVKSLQKPSPLFRVVLKPNPSAKKVIFFLTSYRAPWFIYTFALKTLKKNGYEVVAYDFNDRVLDNDDPTLLPTFVKDLNQDIQSRVLVYQKSGISIFDGVGSSLGSFLLYNYCTRYPLRKVSLNIVSYMARVIFTASDKNIYKIRQRYIDKGYDLAKLEKAWKEIDSPESGKNVKAEQLLLFTALNDKYVSVESANEVIKNIKMSNTKLAIYVNERLGHRTSVLRNVHSKRLMKFLLVN